MKKLYLFKLISLLIISILILGGCGNTLNNIENFDKFTLVANGYTPYGTEPNSKFILHTPQNYSSKEIEKLLSVEPSFQFNVVNTREKEYEIIPKDILELDTEYIFSLSSKKAEKKSFSFKTVDKFKLMKTSFNGNNYSPPLEIVFNSRPVDFEKHLKIEPKANYSVEYIDNSVILELYNNGDYRENTTFTITIDENLENVYGEKLGKKEEVLHTIYSRNNTTPPLELINTTNYDYSFYDPIGNVFYMNILSGEKPFVLFTNNNLRYGNGKGNLQDILPQKLKVDTTIFKLNSYKEYEYFLRRSEKSYSLGFDCDTSNLTKYSSFSGILDIEKAFKNDERAIILDFPDALPNGHYLAQMSYSVGSNTYTLYKLIQVSPYSYYRLQNNTDVQLWFNDTVSKLPVKNANVKINTSEKTKYGFGIIDENKLIPAKSYTNVTDKDGLVNIKLENCPNGGVFILENDGIFIVDLISSASEYTPSFNDKYFSSINLDKNMYKKDDTISFFGVVRPRGDSKPLKTIDVAFHENTTSLTKENMLNMQTVKVEADGTFSGTISYNNLAAGYYEIIYSDNLEDSFNGNDTYQNINSLLFNIVDYVLPDYTYTSKLNKKILGYSDTLEYYFKSSLYDGTPYMNKQIDVNLNAYGKGETTESSRLLRTDKNGELTFSLPVGKLVESYSSWRPMWKNVSARSVEIENTPFEFNDSYIVLPSDTMLEINTSIEDTQTKLEINTHKIDLSSVNSNDDVYSEAFNELIRGAGVSKEVKLEIFKITETKTEKNKYFDPYTKEYLINYDYDYKEEKYSDRTITTDKNGYAIVEGLPIPTESEKENVSYRIIAKLIDGNNVEIIEDGYISFLPLHYGKGSYENKQLYTLSFKGKSKQTQSDSYENRITFDINDNIRASIEQNHKPIYIEKGSRILVNIIGHEEVETNIYDTSSFDIKAIDKLIPFFTVSVAYFDGKNIYAFKPTDFLINTDSVKLDINTSFDKEEYSPGDDVEYTITVKYPDGTPAKDIRLALAVTDERLFANIYELNNIFNDLFTSYRYQKNQITAYTSYSNGYLGYRDFGGKGGGGGDGINTGGIDIRSDFRDTLGYTYATTDKNGVAHIKVTLSEQLTEWRFDTIAIAPDTCVGTDRKTIKSTLPFFIKPIVNEKYLLGDEIGISLRSYGTRLKDTDTIEYTARLIGTDETSTKSEVLKATEYKDISLGTLPIGKYRVQITAKNGTYSDGVELPFEVIETGTTVSITKWVDLSRDEKLPSVTASPVSITLYSKDYDALVKAMQTIAYSNNGRSDEDIAKKLIADKYKEFYSTEVLPSEAFEGDVQLSKYADTMGKGLSGMLHTYIGGGETSIELSGVLATVYPDSYKKNKELNEIISGSYANEPDKPISLLLDLSQTEIASAIMGIYATNTPDEIKNLVPASNTLNDYILKKVNSADLPISARMYYISAISYFDKKAASELYNKYVVPQLKIDGDYAYIPQENKNKEVDVTATALLTSILLDKNENLDKMVSFIAEKQSDVFTHGKCALELSMYVNHFNLDKKDIPSVICNINGKSKDIKLDKQKAYEITLTKEEYENSSFTAKSGNVMASVHYTGRPKDNGFKNCEYMTVTREVKSDKQKYGNNLIIEYSISFNDNAPNGSYTITEFIPTNMRLLPQNYNTSTYYYITKDMSNQKLSIHFNYYFDKNDSPKENQNIKLGFIVQPTLSTKAVTDDIYIINNDSGEGILLSGSYNPADTQILGAKAINNIKGIERDINEEAKNDYIISVADSILKKIITPEMDDLAKLRAIYDYIIQNNKFTEPVGLDIWRYRGDPYQIPSYIEQRAISPMLFGYGMCEDYAAEFVLLARRLGFKAEYVFGMTISVDGDYVDHAWAMVNYNNAWYHVDPQLEDNIMRGGKIKNRYFMRDDKSMQIDHKWGESLINFKWQLSDTDKSYIISHLTPHKAHVSIPSEGIRDFKKNDVTPLNKILKIIQLEKNEYIAKNGELEPIKLNFEPPMVINP